MLQEYAAIEQGTCASSDEINAFLSANVLLRVVFLVGGVIIIKGSHFITAKCKQFSI